MVRREILASVGELTVRFGRWIAARRVFLGTVVGVIVGVAVSYPWVGSGWLLVLDWVSGPSSHVPPSVFGFSLPVSPVSWAVYAAQSVFGGELVSWLAIAGCFPMAAGGVARLIPGGPVAASGGALLYTVNPFVFDRISSGQTFVLFGYALLPWAVGAFVPTGPDGTERRPGVTPVALWMLALTFLSIHYLWIFGVLIAAFACVRWRELTVWWSARLLAMIPLLLAYLLAPLASHAPVGVSVGKTDLALFRTGGDPTLGLYPNVLALYGFWREALRLPKASDPLWPVLLSLILVVVAAGVRANWTGPRATLTRTLVGSGVGGYFLALGNHGPTGWLYEQMYLHVPGFAVMREPQKFVCLLCLAYAILFGLGLEYLGSALPRLWARAVPAALAGLLPLTYTPTIFGGLDGQVRATAYPHSWYAADRVMGRGPGAILFLPWHLYQTFGFTRGHVVATPAADFFRREVIVGDNLEIGAVTSESTSGRSAYLETLYANGDKLAMFGHLVAQLGIRYVVLSRTVDYSNYRWLSRQQDLSLVYDDSTISVFRNEALTAPTGIRAISLSTTDSVASYIDAAQVIDLRFGAVTQSKHAGAQPAGQAAVVGGVDRRSPTTYEVAPAAGKWVVLPEDGGSSWQSSEGKGVILVDGATAVPVSVRGGTVDFAPWRFVEFGYIVSGLSALGLIAWSLLRWVRRRTGNVAC